MSFEPDQLPEQLSGGTHNLRYYRFDLDDADGTKATTNTSIKTRDMGIAGVPPPDHRTLAHVLVNATGKKIVVPGAGLTLAPRSETWLVYQGLASGLQSGKPLIFRVVADLNPKQDLSSAAPMETRSFGKRISLMSCSVTPQWEDAGPESKLDTLHVADRLAVSFAVGASVPTHVQWYARTRGLIAADLNGPGIVARLHADWEPEGAWFRAENTLR